VHDFAMARHSGQMAADGRPYCHHLFEVEAEAAAIANALGLSPGDIALVRQVALLHDVIEDTQADYEEVEAVAGAAAARLVALLSNDKRQPKADRDHLFLKVIATAPLPAQIVKLADLHSNLSAVGRQHAAGLAFNRAYAEKAGAFLAVLAPQLGGTATFRTCHTLLTTIGG